jgi:choline dehydrogenase-like flavoprotein
LSEYGIETKVNLPAVGENLQDQPNVSFLYGSNATFNGTTGYVAYGSLSDIFPSPLSPNISDWATTVARAINNSIPASTLSKLFDIQYSLLETGVPDAETIAGTTVQFGAGPSGYLGIAFWLLMPFSRGNVHIASADPLAYPAINPNYFLIDFDTEVQVAIAKWTRKFWTTEPIATKFTEVSPGAAVPSNATDEEWATYVKTAFTANSHPLGTAAMMCRDLGGVVDGQLKVYGTENVRVVDASVMPFQVSGNLTSTLYAIAEKAADIIKENMGS